MTFEVEIPESTVHSMPSWKRGAINYFRDLRDTSSSPQGMINTMRKRKNITILSEEVEVAP